ncbi:MAG: hypothetical protein ACODAB_09975, partial [Gemmatimonadota bacterium]
MEGRIERGETSERRGPGRPCGRFVVAGVALALASGCSVLRSADDFEVGGADGGMDADAATPDATPPDGGAADGDAGDGGGPDAGECGAASDCPSRPNVRVECVEASCVYTDCAEGFEDCNDTLDDGCEADLASAATCGGCDTACETDELCDTTGDDAQCTLDCDGTVCDDSCVDTEATTQHCGGCDMPCDQTHATASCESSSCVVESCDEGWDDCDG